MSETIPSPSEFRYRSGRYVSQDTGYRAFLPEPLPPIPLIRLEGNLQSLLSLADRALGRLDGSIQTLPNPDLFVFMYVRKEAVLSSQIEGTQSSLQDLLSAEAKMFSPNLPSDVDEVVNYVNAMNHGLERLSDLPVSVRLIKEIHERLLHGVRGIRDFPMKRQGRPAESGILDIHDPHLRKLPPDFRDGPERGKHPLHEIADAQGAAGFRRGILGEIREAREIIHPHVKTGLVHAIGAVILVVGGERDEPEGSAPLETVAAIGREARILLAAGKQRQPVVARIAQRPLHRARHDHATVRGSQGNPRAGEDGGDDAGPAEEVEGETFHGGD